MKRSLKILIAIVASIAAAVLVAALILPFVVNADKLRPQAEEMLQRSLGRRVSLGPLALSLWGGLALHAESLTIGEPLGAPADGALIVASGKTVLHVAWRPLLRREVDVRSVTVDAIELTQDGKPLASGVRLVSSVRVAADRTVAVAGSAEGRLSAMTAAPLTRAEFTASYGAGELSISALDVAVGPMRVKATGRLTGVMSKAPRLALAGSAGLPKSQASGTLDVVVAAEPSASFDMTASLLDGDGAGTVGVGGAVRIDLLASFAKTVSDQLVAKTHALAIRQGPDGRLSVPLQIRGTIQDPRIQLDLQKVIQEGALKQLKEQGTKSLLKKLLGR